MKTYIVQLGLILGLIGGCLAAEADAQKEVPNDPQAEPLPQLQQDKPLGDSNPALNGQQPTAATKPERNLMLNFRGVPLEMVLNYLSDAAGFIILPGQVDVKGKVDVWSNQRLSNDEAVQLLNTILNQNGYTAIQKGRTLQIVNSKDARMQDLPVHAGSDPQTIPKTDQMVTQVIPIRYISAAQIIKDLEPLMTDYAKLTANESGNALVLTDTQSHIRRMTEIIRALDTFPGVTSVKVFSLQYADAKELATAIKDLFQPTTQNNNQGGRNAFFNRFGGGGGGFPGFGGGGPGGGGGNRGGGAGGGSTGGPTQNTKVTAVADERTNSLVVSAPEDIMPSIEELVKQIDVNATDVTELRVFRLLNADPVEVVGIFSELFPDDSKSSEQQNQGFRFGPFGGGFNRGGNARGNQTAGDSSSRATKKGRVIAVADQRTSSIIVSAAGELMPEIAGIISQLDSTSGKKQKVYIYSLENADVTQVEQVVRDMFERNNIQANRNNQNQTSALENRSRQNMNQTSTANRNTGFGNTGSTSR